VKTVPFLCSFVFLFAATVWGDDYDTLRLKWNSTIVGTGYDTSDPDVASLLASIASSANSYWSSMEKSVATRTYLWSDAASTTVSADITTNYARLRAMALAYATPGCSLQGNASLLTDLTGGLDWMNANRYNSTKAEYDNWWDWEIGSPLDLTDIAVLLYSQLTSTQLTNYMNAVDKFTPSATTQAPGGSSGTFTGANRMWKIRVVAVRGAVVKDSVKLAAARDAFSNLFAYVTTGDGFYTDGSYIQHTIQPYTEGYGSDLLANIVPVMAWLSGSTWAVTDPTQSNIYQWVYSSFEPLVYDLSAWDYVRGREISRSGSPPQATGETVADSILQMAQFAPTADAARLKSMVKYWAQSDTVRTFASDRPLPTLTLAKQLMADGTVTPRGELIGHFTFAQMDRVVHLGPGYGFGVSMCSSRIANFESINGENLHGWFTGDGMTILYNADLNQYGDNYWNTIDPYRLPGVTADTTANKLPADAGNSTGPRAQGESTLSAYNWVGGATLGNYGAAGMQLDGWNVTLTAKKSWFMFDNEIVCLGAGITSTDSRPIETIVDNRQLLFTGGNTFTVNGTGKPATLGWTETMTNVNWAHLAGNVTGSDVGYYFPQPATLNAVREARTGTWSDINTGGSTTAVTRNYLRFGFNHGSNPTNATYQYVVLPGRNARRVSQYAAQPQVTVLENDGNIQAATETALGVTAANFWNDGAQTVGGITVNKKASALVQNDGSFLDLSISDPTQANTGSITVQIAVPASATVSADAGVTVTQLTPAIGLTVNVNGALGKTFHARFYIGTPQTVNVSPEADAYVYDASGSANTNFGTATTLIVKKSGTGFNRESYLRFNVPAWNGLLVGATLKLTTLSVSVPGVHGVDTVSNTIWIESGAGSITWNNKPASSGTPLSTWTPAVGTPVNADVRSAITGSGELSLHVYGTTQTTDGYVTYGARENSTTTNRPQLTLLIGHSPPTAALTAPADGTYLNHPGLVTLSANAQGTDGSVTSVAFYDGSTLLGSVSNAPYTLSANLGGGTHLLTAVATDSNGLSKTSLAARLDIAFPPVASAGSASTAANTSIDVDLRSLVTDADTPSTALRFTVNSATNGTVALLADGHTAHFTPNAGYSGPASYAFTATDNSNDDRLLLNYDFQAFNAIDRSGQGRDGTINIQGTGAATYTSTTPNPLTPQQTQSLLLTENGTAGAARVERTLSISDLDLINGNWTVAGWFYRQTATNQDSVFQLGDSGGYASNALTLAFYGTSTTISLLNYNGTTNDVNITRTNVTTGAWHHFGIVRSGTTLSLYIDGTLAGSDTGFGFTFDTTKPVKFGGVSTSYLDRWFNGSLADLAMFNGALSGTEIARLSTEPVANFGGQSAGNTVAITVLSPLDSWRLATFGTSSNTGNAADTANPSGDGILNLMKYALGANPLVSSTAALPTSSVQTVSGQNYLTLTFVRSLSATDVTCNTDVSGGLSSSWNQGSRYSPANGDVLSNAYTTQVSRTNNADGVTETIVVRDNVPISSSTPHRFMRLRVTRP